MQIPQALHAQLYLLGWHREHRCFRFHFSDRRSDRWLFDCALSSAVLTDLYLSGFVEDNAGTLRRSNSADPADSIQRQLLGDADGRHWIDLITRKGRPTRAEVYADLEMSGWVSDERRLFRARPKVYDDDMIGGLASQVTDALGRAITDRPAEPRLLALALIAVQARMPFIATFAEDPQYWLTLHQMTLATIEPILGLHQAVQLRRGDARWGDGGGAGRGGGGCGGCGGGGCGGGG